MTNHDEPCRTLQALQVQVAKMEVYQKENYKHINGINNHCTARSEDIKKAFSDARSEREQMKIRAARTTAYAAGLGAAAGALLIPLINILIKLI